MRIHAVNLASQAMGQAQPSQHRAMPVTNLGATPARGQTPASAAGGRAPTRAPLPESGRLALPSLNQFALQKTYWEARWKPAIDGTRAGLSDPRKVDGALARLSAVVGRASQHATALTLGARREVERAHGEARDALAKAGAPRAALAALDEHLRTFLAWWKDSGRTACARAVRHLQKLGGSTDTGFGKVISGFTRTDVRQTDWYPGLAATPGAPSRPRLYKDRHVTYDLRYEAQRLRFAAATILGKLNGGQIVHVQVLTGWLHKDAGQGRPPSSTHSLAITGFKVEKSIGGQPVAVAFEFLDPDGGGKGILRLDIEQRSFQHVPASVGWLDTGYGWDYDSYMPPHRYQVMTIR